MKEQDTLVSQKGASLVVMSTSQFLFLFYFTNEANQTVAFCV